MYTETSKGLRTGIKLLVFPALRRGEICQEPWGRLYHGMADVFRGVLPQCSSDSCPCILTLHSALQQLANMAAMFLVPALPAPGTLLPRYLQTSDPTRSPSECISVSCLNSSPQSPSSVTFFCLDLNDHQAHQKLIFLNIHFPPSHSNTTLSEHRVLCLFFAEFLMTQTST